MEADRDGEPAPFCAVVLAGGRAARLDGADKASVEIGGRTLLAWALDAVVDAVEVVVVGDPVPTERPVTFTREDPRYGGPVAGLLTGVDALLRRTPVVVVTAVDMPRLTWSTLRRLRAGLGPDESGPGTGVDGTRVDGTGPDGIGPDGSGPDGAVLVGPDGRRQLALALRRSSLARTRPPYEAQHGLALHRLLAPLDLVEVAAEADEHRDVDTWTDLRDLA